MRATCLVNSYNYRPYVVEAVESALAQTRPFEQILIIDDGSTDGSQQLLAERYARKPGVELITKSNGGQLSCFNRAIPQVRGELLFFLDADDRYRPDYLERATACYEQTKCDFLIAGYRNFGPNFRGPQPRVERRDLGLSVLTALFAGTWVGGPTSCLSMRKLLARKVLPFPFEPEWRIRADNVLVYGASVVGAHKYQMGELGVERRVHGANLFYGNTVNRRTAMRNALELNRLFAHYARLIGYNAADLPRLLPREFRTIERPTWKEFRRYLRLSWTLQQSLYMRVKQTFSLTAQMVEGHRTPATIKKTVAETAANYKQHRAA
jgi:glycosyltransferase involved in cell wall biosynthesis